MAVSRNGGVVATLDGRGGTIRFWDVNTGRERNAIRTTYSWDVFSALALSADGVLLATTGHEYVAPFKRVRVRDTRSGKESSTLTVPRAELFPPGFNFFIAGDSSSPFDALAFSPDSRRIAASSGITRKVRVWDIKSGTESSAYRIRGQGGGNFIRLEYSPDGHLLLVGAVDGTVYFLEADSGHELFDLYGHDGPIVAACFSPDGERLATMGSDGTIRFWDLPSRRELVSLRVDVSFGDDNHGSLSFSPDGNRLAYASSFGPVCVSYGVPLTRESRTFREALGLVRFHVHRAASEEAFMKRVQLDSTVSEDVRAKAVALAEGLWKEEAMSRSRKLNAESRDVLIAPGRDEAAYRTARLQAQEACLLQPDEANILNTLGLAHYRLGHYREALAMLTRSNPHRNSLEPCNLAVLAMSNQRLGQTDAARASLVALNRVMKDQELAANADNQSLLHEAEDLILDASFPANPFAP
jgi:hypothetical protein